MQRQLDDISWWNFSVTYLAEHANHIQELVAASEPHSYAIDRPRFVFSMAPKLDTVSFIGIAEGDVVKPLESAPNAVQDYVRQAFSNGPHYWLADAWSH